MMDGGAAVALSSLSAILDESDGPFAPLAAEATGQGSNGFDAPAPAEDAAEALLRRLRLDAAAEDSLTFDAPAPFTAAADEFRPGAGAESE
jgi:hypothetical protein